MLTLHGIAHDDVLHWRVSQCRSTRHNTTHIRVESGNAIHLTMTPANTNNTDRTAQAEDLRLRGNDAFGTADWERAACLYEESLAANPTAKVASNYAAVLAKLGRYTEAVAAAEHATRLDSLWAKGWWRRGVQTELLKNFALAVKFYAIAVELEPQEKVFQQAHDHLERKLRVKTNKDGKVSLPQDMPGPKAWLRVHQTIGGPVGPLAGKYMEQELLTRGVDSYRHPTSQQYIFKGMNIWVQGLQGAVAKFCMGFDDGEAYEEYQALMRSRMPWEDEEDYLQAAQERFGGYITFTEMANLASSLGQLGGRYIVLQKESSDEDHGEAQMCPAPPPLRGEVNYQFLALVKTVDDNLSGLFSRFGFNRHDPKFVCGQSILGASNTLFHNMGVLCPHAVANDKQDPKPTEVVSFIQQQLRLGKTWEGGLLQYVSLHYRGTMLYAFFLQYNGLIALAYEQVRWAHELIDMADKEFQVSAKGDYEEKGSAFRHSFRVGFLMYEFSLLNHLRKKAYNGPYSMEMSLNLLTEIIDTVSHITVPVHPGGDTADARAYNKTQDEVAYCRKPLALAHSNIAAHLNDIRMDFAPEEFKRIAVHHGLLDDKNDKCDPFALIANHYYLAAQNELPDYQDGAIFWWAYATNMARSTSGNYTVGDLRQAIQSAQAAEKARDVFLFGPNPQKGGSYESIAKFVALHFRDKTDATTLVPVEIVRQEGAPSILKVADDVICSDFDRYEQMEDEQLSSRRHPYDELLDTAEIQKEHGQDMAREVPSLETLCIRHLHKANVDYARGETDGAVIVYKAMMMMAAQQQEEMKEDGDKLI